MRTMQEKLTEEFRRLAEDEFGLELVIYDRETREIWYVMDGLDTRTVIHCVFGEREIFRLADQAVREATVKPSALGLEGAERVGPWRARISTTATSCGR